MGLRAERSQHPPWPLKRTVRVQRTSVKAALDLYEIGAVYVRDQTDIGGLHTFYELGR
jgi:hypothetical protein